MRNYETRGTALVNPNLLWAAAFICRNHRVLDIEKTGSWTCGCRLCEAVRPVLSSNFVTPLSPDDYARSRTMGGAL
jgi:hypothetical protein